MPVKACKVNFSHVVFSVYAVSVVLLTQRKTTLCAERCAGMEIIMINWIIGISAAGIVIGTIVHFISSAKLEKSGCGCGGGCSGCHGGCKERHEDKQIS